MSLQEYEAGGDMIDSLDVNFPMGVNYASKTITELLDLHKKLISAGSAAKKIHYLSIVERGKMYDHLKNARGLDDWNLMCTQLDVCKKTAERYILFSRIIDAYPKLIICDIWIEEILSFYRDLNEYLTKNDELLFKLKSPLRQIRIVGGTIHSSKRLPGANTELEEMPLETDIDDLGTVLWRLEDELSST